MRSCLRSIAATHFAALAGPSPEMLVGAQQIVGSSSDTSANIPWVGGRSPELVNLGWHGSELRVSLPHACVDVFEYFYMLVPGLCGPHWELRAVKDVYG